MLGTARADEVAGEEIIVGPSDGVLSLWDYRDPVLERQLETRLEGIGLAKPIADRKVSVALVDLTDFWQPRVATVNGDVMLYAASLPKIAILLAAFQRAAAGELDLDPTTLSLMLNMIRRSSNTAATTMMQRVGKSYIADVLRSPRYKLYDPMHNGGLWAGKDYGAAGLWERDPLHNLSHGATAMQVARFYYLLETGRLISKRASQAMMDIMSKPAIPHKFVKAIRTAFPQANLYRKSGTWRDFHADSAIVEHDGKRYIMVALSHDPRGESWLQQVALAADALIAPVAVALRAP